MQLSYCGSLVFREEGRCRMQFYDYKGFTIYPLPRLVLESDLWSVQLTICRGSKQKSFSPPHEFNTKGEALFHSIHYGKKIIDDEIFGYTVHDIL